MNKALSWPIFSVFPGQTCLSNSVSGQDKSGKAKFSNERQVVLTTVTPHGALDERAASPTPPVAPDTVDALKTLILKTFDDAKAEDTVVIDLAGKSSIADAMIVTSGRSNRHVSAIAEQVLTAIKKAGHSGVRVEGRQSADWVLIDAADIIIHIFRPEVRAFYNLEKMWSAKPPEDRLAV